MNAFQALKMQIDETIHRAMLYVISPQKVAEAYVRKMGQQITTVENGLIELEAEKIRIGEKVKKERAEIEKNIKRAEAAAEAGDDLLAEKALLLTVQHNNNIQEYIQQEEELSVDIKDLEEQVLELGAKKEMLASRISLLSTKLEIARARENYNLLTGGVGGSEYTKQLKNFENEVIYRQSKAIATSNVSKRLGNGALDDQFKIIDVEVDKKEAKKLLSDMKLRLTTGIDLEKTTVEE